MDLRFWECTKVSGDLARISGLSGGLVNGFLVSTKNSDQRPPFPAFLDWVQRSFFTVWVASFQPIRRKAESRFGYSSCTIMRASGGSWNSRQINV